MEKKREGDKERRGGVKMCPIFSCAEKIGT